MPRLRTHRKVGSAKVAPRLVHIPGAQRASTAPCPGETGLQPLGWAQRGVAGLESLVGHGEGVEEAPEGFFAAGGILEDDDG